jgi:hypothetical protein
LVGVVPLALGRQSAQRPDDDRERERQEQKTRGEPQAAAGDARYFLPPLCPFPPPFTFGGVVGADSGAVGAFFACPCGSPWWCSPERANAFPFPCARGAGAPAVVRARPWPRALLVAVFGLLKNWRVVTGVVEAAVAAACG